MKLNSSSLDAINTVFRAIYLEALKGLPVWHRRFFEDVKVMAITGDYRFLARMSKMREWIGDRTAQNMIEHKFSITIKNWESSVAVHRNDIIYDTYGLLKNQVAGLGQDREFHYMELMIDWLLNGHDTSHVVYDSKPLFSKIHPTASGNKPNYYTTTALTGANLDAMDADMRTRVGDDGRILRITPNILWHSTAYKADAEDLINKNPLAGGEGNVRFKRYELVEIPDFGPDALTWGLTDLTKTEKPFILQRGYETDPRWIVEPGGKVLEGLWGFDGDDNMGAKWWQLISRADAA